MRTLFLSTTVALFAMACSAPSSDGSQDVADNEMMEEMGVDEMAATGGIYGSWGIQYEACSEDNAMRDGVVVISQYDVIVGLDECSITSTDISADGVTHFTAQCMGGEGEAYEADFYFSSPQDGVLRWDNRDFDRVEDYVNCDGGGTH